MQQHSQLSEADILRQLQAYENAKGDEIKPPLEIMARALFNIERIATALEAIAKNTAPLVVTGEQTGIDSSLGKSR